MSQDGIYLRFITLGDSSWDGNIFTDIVFGIPIFSVSIELISAINEYLDCDFVFLHIYILFSALLSCDTITFSLPLIIK